VKRGSVRRQHLPVDFLGMDLEKANRGGIP
jgi:hypothetical protein